MASISLDDEDLERIEQLASVDETVMVLLEGPAGRSA